MKTQTDKATARPWQQYHAGIYQPTTGHPPGASAHVCDVISDAKTTPSDKDLANATLIVQAVNEYDALNAVVEAAKNVGMYSRTNISSWLRKSLLDLADTLSSLAALREGK